MSEKENEPYFFYRGLGEDAPLIEVKSWAELRKKIYADSMARGLERLADHSQKDET